MDQKTRKLQLGVKSMISFENNQNNNNQSCTPGILIKYVIRPDAKPSSAITKIKEFGYYNKLLNFLDWSFS